MTKEALKLALDALEEVKSWKRPARWDGCFDKEIAAIKEALSGCQCPECQVKPHASDCAVHNEPAYPKGECNCGAQPEQEPVATVKLNSSGQIYIEWRDGEGAIASLIGAEFYTKEQL